eukprot:CAMPEP_0197861066 /NCGR_PEP_ID=MMETSP1438-20131217/36872_1 /TAXON_ID=1461541 /ORGANISM="Pterosperma sp., Strain CCMP1384" /LENGTH=63 /DNA_ID=CAMNT_0043478127 /DNA_START=108 /DNA_END=299 /DNA_ORIENTATION=+
MDKDKKIDALEEDDEFEEFASENWTADEEEVADAQEWEDDWDDDDISDDFAQQLRAELEKHAK